MNVELLKKEIQKIFPGSQVRFAQAPWGGMIELIYPGSELMDRVTLRCQIEAIYKNCQDGDQSTRLWRFYDYPEEKSRYLQSATLFVLPQKIDHEGNILKFASQDDVSLYIPEFDAEFITHKNYDGHHIPSIERADYDGNYNFPNKPTEFKWLEVLENSYGVKSVVAKPSNVPGNNTRIIDIELKGPRKIVPSGEDFQEYL